MFTLTRARTLRAMLLPALTALACLHGPPAHAGYIRAELALVIDVSGSVSDDDYQTRARGFGYAFSDYRVVRLIDALTAASDQAITVETYFFGAEARQVTAPPPPQLWNGGSAIALGNWLRDLHRPLVDPAGTNIADGVRLATDGMSLLNDPEARQVMLVVGNGEQNAGCPERNCLRTLAHARDDAAALGIEIGAVAVEDVEPDLDSYFESWLITPGGFVEVAANHSVHAFGNAMRDLLIRQLSAMLDDTTSGVPEPGSLGLATSALLLLAWNGRRRVSRRAAPARLPVPAPARGK